MFIFPLFEFWTMCCLFIHSDYFYSTTSSPQLHRDALDTARILCWSFTTEAPQATASEGLAQGPYVATRAGFEPATLRTKSVESTNGLPRPAAWFVQPAPWIVLC